MNVLLGVLMVLVPITALLLGLGVGIGLVLEWLLAVERGMAVLLGVLSTAFAAHLLMQVLSQTPIFEVSEEAGNQGREESFVPPARRRTHKPKR
jgi:hypothetical protein